jgi:AraC family transcriptional regulator
MAASAQASMTIDAEVHVSTANVQIVQFHMTGPADNLLHQDEAYWLDLCLTPRPANARARYLDRWSPHRFERLGKVFLLPAGETLQARSDGNTSQASLLCHLRQESIRRWFDGDLPWTDRRLEASLDIRDGNIRDLLQRLTAELRDPGFASSVMVELMVGQLSIELSRYCAKISDQGCFGGLAPWRLRLIEERLREVRETPTLAELADLCQLSVRQLTRGYRASRGSSIGERIAACQLDHAKQLLESNQSIKAIAYSLGFASPSGFCFAFRRATGQSPRQYRHQLRRPN